MSEIGKFSTHHIPDKGIWYEPGEIVRLDGARNGVEIVKDPKGGYEVHSCRHATEYKGGPALLRIGLRKGSSKAPIEPVALSRLYDA